jgi:hypothetical protein
MTLTANYNTPVSDWTRSIDYALAQWSTKFPGASAVFNIRVFFDDTMPYLAKHTPSNIVHLGTLGGKKVVLPSAAAKLQGYQSPIEDFVIAINRSFPWHFGPGNPWDDYCAENCMLHEIGHALFMTEAPGDTLTPYQIWKASQPASLFADEVHFVGDANLMSVKLNKGMRHVITEEDMVVARACGLPTPGADRIYLIPNSTYVGAGGDIGVWLGAFDDRPQAASGLVRLEMPGDGALTTIQQQVYRLYRAAFGRVPDLAGYAWWLGWGRGIAEMAATFVGTAEFATLYATSDRPTLIRCMYRNILGREPEPTGLQYWIGRTDLDTAGLLLNFVFAPENQIWTPVFSV